MFPTFAHVTAYPLVFPLFYGAVVVFALVMARHLRIFAVARPSRPFANVPRRVAGLVEYALAQRKMFRDLRAGLLHAGIFWGFVLLTVGHGQRRDRRARPGGHRVAARRRPVGRRLGAPERRRAHRPGGHRLGLRAAAHLPAGAPDLHPRRAAHPGDDRRGRGEPSSSPRPPRPPGSATCPARSSRTSWRSRCGASARASRRGCSWSCGGPTSRSWRRSSSTCRSASTSTSSRASPTSTCASSPRAASCRRWTSRPRTRRSACGRSRTSAGRTSSTASRAPSAAAARRPARPTSPASRSTPRR